MLQYVDDILFFFSKPTLKSVFNIKVILNCFELASSLKVNFLKSRIGGVRVDQTQILHFASILNCDVMKTHFIYLGLPVGGAIRGVLWDGVVERIKIRLG